MARKLKNASCCTKFLHHFEYERWNTNHEWTLVNKNEGDKQKERERKKQLMNSLTKVACFSPLFRTIELPCTDFQWKVIGRHWLILLLLPKIDPLTFSIWQDFYFQMIFFWQKNKAKAKISELLDFFQIIWKASKDNKPISKTLLLQNNFSST